MEGVIHVLAKSQEDPEREGRREAAEAQIDRDFKIAKTLKDQKPPANTIYVGNAGTTASSTSASCPGRRRCPSGRRSSSRSLRKSFETHTATTGPGDPIKDPNSYLGIIAASFFSPQFVPQGIYPSAARSGRSRTLTPTSHGNGFWNSGAAGQRHDLSAAELELGDLHAPGTYEFYCMVHPQMHGTVIVQ